MSGLSKYEGFVKVWKVYQSMKGLRRYEGFVKERRLCQSMLGLFRYEMLSKYVGFVKAWKVCQAMQALSRYQGLSRCTNTEHWLNILKWNILSQLLNKISFKVKGSKCPFKIFGKKSWCPYFFLQVGSVLQPTLAWPLFQMVLTITQLWKGRSAKKMHTHIFLDIYFFAFTLEALGFHILLKRAKRASRGPSWPSDDA